MFPVAVEYNSYAEYLNDWQEAIEAKMFPIHVMYYEDLVKVGLSSALLLKYVHVDEKGNIRFPFSSFILFFLVFNVEL